jgi:hypothetical protein
MSTPPTHRRRGKPPATTGSPEIPATESSGPDSPARGRSSEPASTQAPGLLRRVNANVVWALITGLAVGFAVGREAYRFGLSGTNATESTASTAFIAAEGAPAQAYAKMADFPAGWVKESDLAARATLLAGLTDAQKTTVMQALNERNCECGCPFGTLAHCLQKDPNCPRSPAVAKVAVDLAKQGKSLGEILTAIDSKQKDMASGQKQAAPPPPTTPQRVELAAWNPRKGPKAAKVTIVEFSDFQ